VSRRRKLFAGVVLALCAAAAVVIVLTAGGGSDTQSSSTTVVLPLPIGPVLTPAEYRRKATAICASAPKLPNLDPSSSEDAAATMRRLAQLTDEQVTRLGQLRPPAALTARAQHVLTLVSEGANVLREAADATSAGDNDRMTKTDERLSALAEQSDVAWRGLGLPTCAG